MGLFDRNKQNPGPAPPPAPNANKYTVENIERLLDEIGNLRLGVRRASMKLLVSRVAWETQKYIVRVAQGGSPPGRVVAELQEQLGMIKNVIITYIDIQEHPENYAARGDVPALMAQGTDSLRKFADKLDASSSGGGADITGYVVDTKILSTHFN